MKPGEAGHKKGLEARILIPLTRAHGGPALQFEVGLTSLDQLEEFRHRGAGSKGFMGLGHSHYPVPWGALKYDTSLGGFRTNISEQQLKDAPEFSRWLMGRSQLGD